jgi:hypothetical protein
MLVAVTVLSRRAEDLNEFMDQLETTGRFREVLNRQDTITDEGLTRSVLQGYYEPPGVTADAPPASSENTGNSSPAAPVNGSATAPQGER